MQYLLLIYDDEDARWNLSPEESSVVRNEYVALVGSLGATYVGGAPLQHSRLATSVRVRDGKATITDGPFAETREQLGGYFLIEAADLAEAQAIAARMPGARAGTIEIRPLVAM
ncbi:MAG TPA: YciI family protein [Kofleriaceae bacterium]